MNIFKFGTISQQFKAGQSIAPIDVRGEEAFTTTGTYTWVAPEGVTSVSVVAIGGGASGTYVRSTSSAQRNGGNGGALAWKNNIDVIPGQSYTVVVGNGGGIENQTSSGTRAASAGTSSYFKDETTVWAQGGQVDSAGAFTTYTNAATWIGDGGGNGGVSNGSGINLYGTSGIQFAHGSGSAGGYTGNGASTNTATTLLEHNTFLQNKTIEGNSGSGAAGWSHRDNAATFSSGGAGGGTGIYGLGANGLAEESLFQLNTLSGSGGNTTDINSNPRTKQYGGGGNNYVFRSTSTTTRTLLGWKGGSGAVRIVWGAGREFPSTDVGLTEV
jgi:hypothetical protein